MNNSTLIYHPQLSPEKPAMLAFFTFLSLPILVALFGTFLFSVVLGIKTIVHQIEYLPIFYFKESTLANHLLKKCRISSRIFKPAGWVKNKHIQTLMPWLVPKVNIQFDREYLQLRDRGIVALDWVLNLQLHKRKKRTVMVVIPGLTGNAVSCSQLCESAARKGFQPVVFNRRGHGNSSLTTPKLQSYGDPSDLRQVMKYIHGRFPKALITMVSYGTGSELMLSYLGEFGSSAYVYAGVCISPSFDIYHRTDKNINKVYDMFLLCYLKKILWTHAKALTKIVDIPKALCTWSLKKYDECVYCNMYGCENPEDFWDRNNPLRDVDDISIPLLFISSLDDPFYDKKNIPFDLFKYYPNFFMLTVERGGHCGFFENFSSNSWADKLALDYLEAILEFTIKGYTIDYHSSPARSTI